MSRDGVFSRALASASEFYLARRYFPRTLMREMFWQSVLGTFSIRGGFLRRAGKFVISGLTLPATVWQLRSRIALARSLEADFPKIPNLETD